jgi:uncharacterized membrane protein
MALRSGHERFVQALAYELGGLLLAIPLFGLAMDAGAAHSFLVVAAMTLAVLAWSPLHNLAFDVAEWRLAGRVASDRPARWRVVHALSHEATDTMVSLPVIMLVGGYGFWEAVAIDVAMTLLYAGYTYVFHLGYDWLRPVRAADGGIRFPYRSTGMPPSSPQDHFSI